jgi:ubiquinone/menaquinone biosynthesis C-methylase UbiE
MSPMESSPGHSDHRALFEEIRARTGKISLELGCGNHKVDPDAVGIDQLALDGVDIVGDVADVLRSLDDGSVSSIYSSHFLEHIADTRGLLAECGRVLQVGGTFTAVVPHFSSPFFYSDPTHTTAFGLYTFNYLVARSFTNHQVPQYAEALPFAYRDATFSFKSSRPHYVRHAFKQLGRVVNWTTWTKELYEENWSWIFPAYEVRYDLERIAEQ